MSSVLDRLMMVDDAPSDKEVFDSLRRDLEDLLNSHQWADADGHGDNDKTATLSQSLLKYGTRGIVGTILTNKQSHDSISSMIRRAIETFEPRLKNVNVSVLDVERAYGRVQMRITADVVFLKGYEPVVFETSVDPVTDAISIVNRSL